MDAKLPEVLQNVAESPVSAWLDEEPTRSGSLQRGPKTARVRDVKPARTREGGRTALVSRLIAHDAGKLLLRARGRAELVDRLEEAVEMPTLGLVTPNELAEVRRLVRRQRPRSRPPRDAVKLFGEHAASTIERGITLARSNIDALPPQAATQAGGSADGHDEVLVAPPASLRQVIADPTLPAWLCKLYIEIARSGPSLFALSHARSHGIRLRPWMANALAQYWCEGQYALARILASMPDTSIPAEVVPPSDRLDFSRLEREMDARRRRLDESYRAAKARGFAIDAAIDLAS